MEDNLNNTKDSPTKSILGALAPFLGGGGAGALSSLFGGGGAGGALGTMMGNPQMMQFGVAGLGNIMTGLMGRRRRRARQREAQGDYDTMRDAFENLDTSNLYANVQNPYANMENTMEDLTVNQQAAQFQTQQGAQQRANIMQSLQGAAGSSGVAGLAQSLANQAQLQTQKISAGIGQQEAMNQRLMAQQAGRLQQMERVGERQAEMTRLSGASQARALDWKQTGTMFGMAQGRLASANQAIAQANSAVAGGVGQVAGALGGAYALNKGMDKAGNLITDAGNLLTNINSTIDNVSNIDFGNIEKITNILNNIPMDQLQTILGSVEGLADNPLLNTIFNNIPDNNN